MANRITIGLTKREAEVYRSQGLFTESLTLYEQLLEDTPGIDNEIKASIHTKISALKTEMARLAEDQKRHFSKAEIELIRQSLGDQKTHEEILLSAAAFAESGLYAEAIREHCKLMGGGCPPDRYAGPFTACLLAAYPADTFYSEFTKIISEAEIQGLNKAILLFRCGQELETRDFSEIAIRLYKLAFLTSLDSVRQAQRNRAGQSVRRQG